MHHIPQCLIGGHKVREVLQSLDVQEDLEGLGLSVVCPMLEAPEVRKMPVRACEHAQCSVEAGVRRPAGLTWSEEFSVLS